jgi:hypothetical protein
MGRHHNRKVMAGAAIPTRRYGMAPFRGGLGGLGGVAALLPLVGVAAVVAILFSLFRRKTIRPALGGCYSCSL